MAWASEDGESFTFQIEGTLPALIVSHALLCYSIKNVHNPKGRQLFRNQTYEIRQKSLPCSICCLVSISDPLKLFPSQLANGQLYTVDTAIHTAHILHSNCMYGFYYKFYLVFPPYHGKSGRG